MVNGEICIGLFALRDIKKVHLLFALFPSESFTERISVTYDWGTFG